MAEKPNKNMIIGIAVAAFAVIAIIIGVVLAKGNGEGDNGSETGEEGTSINTDASDYSNIDVSIEYGDFDEMSTLSKDIQNGYALGKIVEIDGIVSRPMSKYSIVQEDKETSSKVGTEFVIEGVQEDEYPEDGTRVVLKGEVVEKSALYFVIKTTPENIRIVEETEDAGTIEGDDIELETEEL